MVYVGSKTGRDGIHGATMASAEFDEDSEEKRPTVQVGDPFTEKLLLEACLELMATDAIVAIQDMGAAGLTSSSFEMAAKGGQRPRARPRQGAAARDRHDPLRADALREPGAHADRAQARPRGRRRAAIFEKWELDFAVIGHLTDTERMVLTWHGDDRRRHPDPAAGHRGAGLRAAVDADASCRPCSTPRQVPAPKDWNASLLTLMSCPDLASKAWIWHQYDHLVMGNTAIRPRRRRRRRARARAATRAWPSPPTARRAMCRPDPETGGRQAVAEAWRNLTAIGAQAARRHRQPELRQSAEARDHGPVRRRHRGHRRGLPALDFPVVSGNVSLYNETKGRPILPTPTIGAVGLIDDIAKAVGSRLTQAGLAIVLIGETKGWLGQSLYLRELDGREEGAPPPVDLAVERRNGDFVRGQIDAAPGRGLPRPRPTAACWSPWPRCASPAARASTVALPAGTAVPSHAFFYGEDQARYLIATGSADDVLAAAADGRRAGRPARLLGRRRRSSSKGLVSLPLSRHQGRPTKRWLPTYMNAAE